LVSARLARQYVDGLDFAKFEADVQTQDSVVHRLELIGEAVGKLPDAAMAAIPGIPWSQIRGMRNLLAHQYWDVDLRRVWAVVRDDLPPLLAAIEAHHP